MVLTLRGTDPSVGDGPGNTTTMQGNVPYRVPIPSAVGMQRWPGMLPKLSEEVPFELYREGN